MPIVGDFSRKFGMVRRSNSGRRPAEGRSERAGIRAAMWKLRPWKDRNKIVFDGRKGFLKLAHAQRVKIVPVVAMGGQETFFVLNDGRSTAKFLRFDKLLRVKTVPLSSSFPWGLLPGDLPRIPFPAKIRIQVLRRSTCARCSATIPVGRGPYGYVTSAMQVALSGLATKTVIPVVG